MSDWRDRAACLALDPDDFDPVRGYRESADEHAERLAAVKAMCAACPVAKECREAELDSGRKPWHIRAGDDPDQLLEERNRRIRQRSRKRVKARALAKETA